MRAMIALNVCISLTAVALVGGCSFQTEPGPCDNVVTATANRLAFSASPGAWIRVITSPPTDKSCRTDLGIKIRYQDENRSQREAPQNIDVEFAVEGGSGPATIFPNGEPQYTTLYNRRYVQYGFAGATATEHNSESVNYYIRIGTNAKGDFPVFVDAVMRYVSVSPGP